MHRSRTRFVAGLAAAALPLAFLAGCGEDEPEPKFEESTSESPSASSTPDDAEVDQEPRTDAGAMKFARRVVRHLNEMKESGSTDAFEAITTPRCQSCANFIATTRQVYEAGGAIESKPWRIDQLAVSRSVQGRQARVALRVEQYPQKVTVPGERVQRFDGGFATYSLYLRWDHGWRLDELVKPQ